MGSDSAVPMSNRIRVIIQCVSVCVCVCVCGARISSRSLPRPPFMSITELSRLNTHEHTSEKCSAAAAVYCCACNRLLQTFLLCARHSNLILFITEHNVIITLLRPPALLCLFYLSQVLLYRHHAHLPFAYCRTNNQSGFRVKNGNRKTKHYPEWRPHQFQLAAPC